MDIKAVMAVALQNWWISGADAIDKGDPCAAAEFRLTEQSFSVINDLNELKRLFEQGNWCMNQAFIYRNLAFINQIDGGDEWYTIKQFGDGACIAFESISFLRMIEDDKGEFEEYMTRLLRASKEQCQKLTY